MQNHIYKTFGRHFYVIKECLLTLWELMCVLLASVVVIAFQCTPPPLRRGS